MFDVLHLVRSKILSQGLNTCPLFLRHSGEQAAQGLEEVGVVVDTVRVVDLHISRFFI